MAPALLNNRYRTIRQLGSGGFGETFLAEDTYMPSMRRCVIKQLKPATGNPQIYQLVRDRFQREAAVLEELGEGSSQIPKLYAYFSERGQFYLVQEWIEGVTLTEKVRAGGKLKESEVRGMLVSLLPVLDYIHRQHIVHRDIKPDNIIVRQRDGVPVLIDFGAVKEAMGAALNSQGNPTHSIMIGTPGFMPSEQAAGKPLFSSDLYALALTAIFLLTGKTPQELEIDPRSGEFVWHRHATHITPGFVAVLDKAIQYHPRDRYPNAPAMLSALQSLPAAPAAPARAGNMSQMQTQAVSPGFNRGSAAAQPPQSAGEGDWHKPAIVGGIVGAFALIGLLVAHSQPSPVGAGGGGTGSTPVRSDKPTAKPTKKPPAISSPDPKQAESEIVKVDIQRVTFNLGSTGKTVRGTVAPGEIKRYQVKSAKGQQFTVIILQGNVRVDLYDQLDQKLGTASESNTEWSGTLPISGDYNVEITSDNTSKYEVRIEVLYRDATSGANLKLSAPAVSNSKPSPEEAVRDYYSNIINNRLYDKGWNQLSERFKRNHSNDSFDTYTGWWNLVERVQVEKVKRVESGPDSAVVDVGLRYIMKDGRVAPESQRLSMIWDRATGSWLIDDTR